MGETGLPVDRSWLGRGGVWKCRIGDDRAIQASFWNLRYNEGGVMESIGVKRIAEKVIRKRDDFICWNEGCKAR